MIRTIIFITIFAALALPQNVPEYRSDYEYDRKLNSFYKLHTEEEVKSVARETCEAEGATLMTTSPLDVVQAHGMLKQFPDIGNYVWAGDQTVLDSKEEVGDIDTDDDQQCETVSRDGEVLKMSCYQTLPFVCKMDANLAQYHQQCKVYSKEYQYLENVGSCYRISSAALSWNQAYAECEAEGAHLLVLNSDLEHRAVHNLTHHAPKISNTAHSPWYWHAGIRAEKPKDGSTAVYKTIFGQTLQAAGYDQWSVGEPNNYNGLEYCGSIFTNDGKYNDLKCSDRYAFICEKEINK